MHHFSKIAHFLSIIHFPHLKFHTGRVIQDKLPNINQPTDFDEELRDRDKSKKEKEKAYADDKRHAKVSDIKVGDEVWLRKLVNTNKLSAKFEPVAFRVVSRQGSELLVENIENGARYRRNITHVIKAPPSQNKTVEGTEEESMVANKNDNEDTNKSISLEENETVKNTSKTADEQTEEEEQNSAVKERRVLPQRKRKAPASFGDYIRT